MIADCPLYVRVLIISILFPSDNTKQFHSFERVELYFGTSKTVWDRNPYDTNTVYNMSLYYDFREETK